MHKSLEGGAIYAIYALKVSEIIEMVDTDITVTSE